MDTTTAIIQFIGIVLFSSQVPNDPGIHAILPRIGHVHKSDLHTMPKLDPKQTGEQHLSPTGIENHVSVIMYRDADRLYKTGGWRSDGGLANGWSYLALDGERVQFLTHSGNGRPEIPRGLPRTGSACGAQSAPPTLRAEFLPPYRGAAAVIDIPEGQLSSCQTSTVNVASRLDTRLVLDTRGVLVVTATKKNAEPKALMLRGDAVVFIANIPPYALLQDTDLTIGEPHWTAYNAMLAEPCAARPAVDEQFADILLAYCDVSSLGDSYYRARKQPPIQFRMIDSGCSNTQWP